MSKKEEQIRKEERRGGGGGQGVASTGRTGTTAKRCFSPGKLKIGRRLPYRIEMHKHNCCFADKSISCHTSCRRLLNNAHFSRENSSSISCSLLPCDPGKACLPPALPPPRTPRSSIRTSVGPRVPARPAPIELAPTDPFRRCRRPPGRFSAACPPCPPFAPAPAAVDEGNNCAMPPADAAPGAVVAAGDRLDWLVIVVAPDPANIGMSGSFRFRLVPDGGNIISSC